MRNDSIMKVEGGINMAEKYMIDPDAYKRRLQREKEFPELKERFKFYEKTIADQPTFATEDEAVKFAVEKTKKGERWTVWVAPKELGGKWKAISWASHRGMGPEAADQLGWSMIYDSDLLQSKASKYIDHIKEI